MASNKSKLYIKIGKRVKEARKLREMTQEQLAEVCDISWSAISRLENGSSAVSLKTLMRVASALDIGIEFLLQDVIVKKNDLDDSVVNEILGLLALCDVDKKKYFLENIKLVIKNFR